MKNQKVSRNIGIDFLRVISIVYIVGFWHMLNYTNAIPNYRNIVTYRITWIILGTFLFISGYFIGKKRVEINKKSLKYFYINRILRIYPLYCLSIIIFTYFGLSDFNTSLKAAFLISTFFVPQPPTLWFITMLMIFYVSSPFIMVACQNISIIKLITIYIVLTILLLFYWYSTRLIDTRIIVYLPSFVFGLFTSHHETRISTNKYLLYLALVIAIILSFATNTSYDSLNMLFATPMIAIVAYLLFTLFRKVSIQHQKVKSSILIVGYSSYCMYLFHRPIYMILKKLYFPDSSILQLTYLVTFCLPCIWLFSYSIQKSYDNIIQVLTHHSRAKVNPKPWQ
jgi:peptidoglycan/LPS O-acetylase OafA/YrhL